MSGSAIGGERSHPVGWLEELLKEASRYKTCMSLCVNEESLSVELILDTAVSYYGEHIKGEGCDIAIYREHGTNRVVGVRLPLRNNRLSVICGDMPIRINAGFLKENQP